MTAMSDHEFATYVYNARQYKPKNMELPTARVLGLVDRIAELEDAIRDHQSGLETWTRDMYGRWQLVREADALLWSVLDATTTGDTP